MNHNSQLSADLLSTFKALPDPYLIISPNLSILAASDAYLLATSTTRKEITGKFMAEVFSLHSGQINPLQDCLQKVLATGKPRELIMHQYDGAGKLSAEGYTDEKHWFTLNTPVLNEHGQVLYIIHKISEVRGNTTPGHGQNETDSAQAGLISGQKQEVHEDRYRTLFESMDQGFCIIEMIFDKDNKPLDYRFTELNAVFEEQTGLKEAAGKTARELIPNLETHWFELYGQVALSGNPVRFTQGSEAMGRWFEVYAYRLGGDNSHTVAILFSDITARKQAEIKLKESEQRFGGIFNQTSVGIALTDLAGKFILVNGQYCEIVGWPEEKLYQMHLYDITHPEDIPANSFLLEKVIDESIPFSIEKRYIRSDGSLIWVNVNVSVVKDAEGKSSYIVGICSDITAHKQALEALRDSERRLSRIIEASNDGIWEWDFVNDRAWWNSRYTEIMGANISQDKRGLRAVNDYIHPDDRHLVPDALKAHLERGEKYEVEFRFVRPSGEIRHVLSKGKAVMDGEGKVNKLSGTVTDITERKKIEEALRESEQLFRTFANNIQNLAWIADPMDGFTGTTRCGMITLALRMNKCRVGAGKRCTTRII
jgi:PAS domain S-box-containing protein